MTQADPAGAPQPHLGPGQFLVGIVHHQSTGTYAVFLSLDGNDIRLLAAHHDEERARTVYDEAQQALKQEASECRLRRLVDARPETAAELAQDVRGWTERLRRWQQGSTAPLLPFPDEQLATLGQVIGNALAHRNVREPLPPLAPDAVRTTEFTPGAPPQVTTAPLPPPAPLSGHSQPRFRKSRRNKRRP